MKVNCLQCNVEFDKKPSNIKRRPNHYCSKECSNGARRTSVTVECTVCSKKIKRCPSEIERASSKTFYCSRSCAVSNNNGRRTGENNPQYTTGEGSYREFAKRELEHKCNDCGYNTETKILQVHHIDHNRKNNKLNNLVILCPNCHSIRHLVVHGSTQAKPA